MNEKRPTITIRDAVQSDLETIVAFNSRLAQESEDKRLDEVVLRAGVRRALASPTLCRYFVAEIGGTVVGQTMVTYELTDWRDGLIYWIQSVYVHPDHRGAGVFKSLYRHVLATAKAKGDGRAVRLYVEKDNVQAIATYERLGMSRSHFHLYETAGD